jgi:cell division protease FtsH
MLAGRLAELIEFGEVTTGAEEDLKQATQLARHMITNWGMSKSLGPVAYIRGEKHIFLGKEMTQQRDFSEHMAQLIDEEVCQLLKEIENNTKKLLKTNYQKLKLLALTLLEKETLEFDAIESIINAPPIKSVK